jgi:hypothetical protein
MRSRYVLAGFAAAAAFSFGCALMIWLMEQPLRPLDYFLGGVVGTFLALAALFIGLASASRWENVFYKKRRIRSGRRGA